MTAMDSRYKRSILIINPNTTSAMTDGLKPLVESLGLDTTRVGYFTAPEGVPSINNETDAAESAEACLPKLKTELENYDAFLVCCYSQHPLVPQLRKAMVDAGMNKPVTGIFEASVGVCLQSIDIGEKFGIVSTGSQWEEILGDAVTAIVGAKFSERYAGCQTTGLNADELHTAPKEEVDKRMKEATKRLLDEGAKAICLGCAGMAGMDQTVREACIEALGEEDGRRITIVDGVVAGTIFLEGAVRAGL
ncbi:putative asp/Glu/hydantoin racemase [Septoria linicola]|nr:putative asp/Glu/hydantoin racemase [Septoria linicola]